MQFSDIKFGARGIFVPAKNSADQIILEAQGKGVVGIPAVVSRIHPGKSGAVAVICEFDGGLITRNCYTDGYGGPFDDHFIPADPMKEAVNVLVHDCHGASVKACWWTHAPTGMDLIHVLHQPSNELEKYIGSLLVTQKLCLSHSELSEAMEGHRKGLMDDKLPHRTMLEVELADAMIRIADLAGALRLDLGGAVQEKLAYNAHRPDHKLANRIAEGGKSY